MPQFQMVTITEAMLHGRKRRGLHEQEYLDYLNRVGADQAGKLIPSDGETPMAVRRRLTSAAKAAGRTLKVVRAGDEIYFWNEAPRKRRGRPRRTEA